MDLVVGVCMPVDARLYLVLALIALLALAMLE